MDRIRQLYDRDSSGLEGLRRRHFCTPAPLYLQCSREGVTAIREDDDRDGLPGCVTA